MKRNIFLIIFSIVSGLSFSQTIQLTNVSQNVFCSTGKDTVEFSVNYASIPQNSNIVFYQSTNPNFNPYLGQGDSIGFINIGGNTNSGTQITSTCPKIIGIFIDACNQPPLVEQDNEYIVITSGNGFKVSNLKVDLPANASINISPSSCVFSSPSASMMALLRTGACTNTTLLAAGQADSIPPNAIVIIFTGNGPIYPYNFSSYCSSGQPIYILQNSCHPGNGSFVNNKPGGCPGSYRSTTIQNRSCFDRLTYDACSLPTYNPGNPNANDGNFVIRLTTTDTSSTTNGGIVNNAADKCNGVTFDSIVGNKIIKFPIPNDGGANTATNFCNTGNHYIKAITHPNGSQPISNTIQFSLVCLDISTNVNSLSICSDSSAKITASSTDPNATFSWTVSGGSGITGASAGSGNTINQALHYNGSTKDSVTYLISAKDATCSVNKAVKVVVNKCDNCTPFNLGNDTTYCGPFTRVLKSGNATTVWSTGVTADSITVSNAGTYTATCGAFSDAITLSQSAPINFDFGANSTSVCKNGNISLDASTAFDTYNWSTGAHTHDINITIPGKYWVDVFKNGCKGSDTILVVEIDKEPKPNLGNDISACSPLSQSLSTGKANTTWYLNTTSTQVGTGASYTATQFGSYIAKVTNSCGDVFDTIKITQTNTQAPINLGRDTTYCGAFSTILSTGNTATVWSTGVTAASITISSPGKYFATINEGCGIVSDTINISQSSGINFDFGSNSTSVCKNGNISLDASTAFDSYVWSTGAHTHDINITQPGKYWVDVFKNGCKGSDTITVVEIDKEPKPNLGRDTSFCGNFSKILTTGNPQTQWFRNTVSITTASSITINQSGTYVAKITNSCGTVADTIEITNANALNLNLGKDTVLCNGNSLRLNAFVAGNNITYVWNTGEQTPSISVNQFGKYDVTVSNGLCTVTDTIFVDITNPPTINSLGNDTAFCGSFSTILFTGDAGTIWNTGVVGPQISVTKAGTFIAENKNECGSAKDTIVFKQFASPIVNLGKDSTICDSIILSVGNGNFVSILWNTNDTTPSIIVTQSGTYSVTVSNANCKKTDSVKITKECFYDVYIPTAFSPNSDGINDVFIPMSNVKGMQVLTFLIYNRWGEKVFESSNFAPTVTSTGAPTDITKGWNGTFKGQPAQVDNYVYYFTAKLPDDKVKVYKGTFALLR